MKTLLPLIILSTLFVGGCESYPVEQARADRDAIATSVSDLPDGPRKEKAVKLLEALDRLIAAKEAGGDWTSMLGTLGPYGGLAAVVIGVFRHIGKDRADHEAMKGKLAELGKVVEPPATAV